MSQVSKLHTRDISNSFARRRSISIELIDELASEIAHCTELPSYHYARNLALALVAIWFTDNETKYKAVAQNKLAWEFIVLEQLSFIDRCDLSDKGFREFAAIIECGQTQDSEILANWFSYYLMNLSPSNSTTLPLCNAHICS